MLRLGPLFTLIRQGNQEMRIGLLFVGLLALTGCASPPNCPYPGTSPMLVAQLYFGRADVADTAWSAFVSDTLTAHFPDGFTAVAARGQWREAPGQPIGQEASEMVIVAAPDTPATHQHLKDVMAAYRERFAQKSVGLILEPACAAF